MDIAKINSLIHEQDPCACIRLLTFEARTDFHGAFGAPNLGTRTRYTVLKLRIEIFLHVRVLARTRPGPRREGMYKWNGGGRQWWCNELGTRHA